MKRLMVLGVFAFGLALPTHAQTAHTAAGGAANPQTSNGGGGGWGGGGGYGGTGRPVNHPPTQFNTTSVSGSQNEYVPSVFVSYDRAITKGQLDTPPPTVAEAARQQSNTHPEKAKLALVQDIYGKAMVVPQ